MPIYRGTTPLKPYRGDMQPVNIYRGVTKLAGWHAATASGQSTLAVDCDYNVPPDALTIDGKCVQVVSCWGTNLLSNSDFSNGYVGWFAANISRSISSNEFDVLTTTTTSEHYSDQVLSSTPVAGHKYYGRVYCEPIVGKCRLNLFNRKDTGAFDVAASAILSSTGVASAVVTVSSLYATPTFLFRLTLLNSTGHGSFTGTTEETKFSYACLIDLTAAFGAGKEPSAATMDVMMSAFPNSWFNGSAMLSTDTTTYTANSPSPSFPATIATITGDVGITGADGASSDTATVAFGSAVCASLPDGTHDSYDAITGVLTRNVGKYVGVSSTSWTISDAATDAPFVCNCIASGTLSGQTLTATAACVPTVYYKLATSTTTQLTPHLPVVRTGIKTLSIGADVVPTISATVKAMD